MPEQQDPPFLFEDEDGLTDSAGSYLHRRTRHQPPQLLLQQQQQYNYPGSKVISGGSSSYLRGSSYLRNGGASGPALLGDVGGRAALSSSSTGLLQPAQPSWYSTSHLDRRSQRLLGRQLSASSELPLGSTASDRYYSAPPPTHNPLHHQMGLANPLYQQQMQGATALDSSNRLHPPPLGLAASGLHHHHHRNAANSFGSLSGRSPLTLGRSLQLVTSGVSLSNAGGGGVGSGVGVGVAPNPNSSLSDGYSRRKKTVRFNSEEWGAGSSANAAGAGLHPHMHHQVHQVPLLHPDGGILIGSELAADGGDLWMTVDDVRSGRWARWDALRQESQESTTRDSGIETGSCFTSSEDSNRGDHMGKKVKGEKGKGGREEKKCFFYVLVGTT